MLERERITARLNNLIPHRSCTVKAVQELSDAGADVNGGGGNLSLLDTAARCGRTDIVELLLQAGADVDTVNPLAFAAGCGYFDIVKLLVASGADVNLRVGDNTPLIAAVKGRNPDIVRLLLRAGADVNAEVNGKTASDISHEERVHSVTRLLR